MTKFQCPVCQAVLDYPRDPAARIVQCIHCLSYLTAPCLPTSSAMSSVAVVSPNLNMLSLKLKYLLARQLGKYIAWASEMSGNNLECLLWAVGEFGRRWTATRLWDGSLPEPTFYRDSMAEIRMRLALHVLVKIQSVGRVTLYYGPFAPGETNAPYDLSEYIPAFTDDYRERLSRNMRTAWAQGLDERNLTILLWMVGEYAVRVNSSPGPDGGEYPPPTFDASPTHTKPLRAALRIIAKIYIGESMIIDDMDHRLKNCED